MSEREGELELELPEWSQNEDPTARRFLAQIRSINRFKPQSFGLFFSFFIFC